MMIQGGNLQALKALLTFSGGQVKYSNLSS